MKNEVGSFKRKYGLMTNLRQKFVVKFKKFKWKEFWRFVVYSAIILFTSSTNINLSLVSSI